MKLPFPLFKKRSIWLPSWQTTLISAVLFLATAIFLVKNIHGFLGVTKRAEGARVLVIEGWVPDRILQDTFDISASESYGYDLICTTGAPLSRGHFLAEHSNYAELSASTLKKLGVPPETLLACPSGSHTRDRTYQSAISFNELRANSDREVLRNATAVDVLTVGLHGRRTRTVFRKALGKEIEVGVISPHSGNYDADRWYASSEGVKLVLVESISLSYEWLGLKDR